MSNGRPDPVVAFLGAALMGVGAMVAALCGACTLLFSIGLLHDAIVGRAGGGNELHVDFPTVALIGGLPTLMGVGLFMGGRSLRRSAAPRRRE